MHKKIVDIFQKIHWKEILLVIMMIMLDIAIHPLTYGPDRYIHDPAVYRIENENYLSGDWYADMAVESKVYIFYSKLVHFGDFIRIPEEIWRQCLYLVSLSILFYSILRIFRIFFPSIWGALIIIFLHAYLILNMPPPWLYGSFMQIDGGLAPRSIGVAFSFLSLLFLLKNARALPWVFLGLATLVHVSNSLIVFCLFLSAYLIWSFLEGAAFRRILRKAIFNIVVYIVSGGWFALYVATQSSGLPPDFSIEKFIWVWIYFRASYMALPLVSTYDWIIFSCHLVAIIGGWFLLRRYGNVSFQKQLNLLSIIGIGATVFFFLFYIFTFVWPWLPGFQFYSLRVICFTYFIAYLYFGVALLTSFVFLMKNRIKKIPQWERSLITIGLIGMLIIFSIVMLRVIPRITERVENNYKLSWSRFLNDDPIMPKLATEKYIIANPSPFLSPPDWYVSPRHSTPYIPSATSFKSFGFTPIGALQWFERMNDMSRGELQHQFEKQQKNGRWEPVSIKWKKYYSELSSDEVCLFVKKYSVQYFLTYKELEYPFPLIVEDEDFRLYQVGQCRKP